LSAGLKPSKAGLTLARAVFSPSTEPPRPVMKPAPAGVPPPDRSSTEPSSARSEPSTMTPCEALVLFSSTPFSSHFRPSVVPP